MTGERPCPEPLRGCPYDDPFADDHHRYWPGSEYTTPTEKKFRRLEVNVVRGICRCLHNLEHLKQPPEKPSLEEMREAISGTEVAA